MQNIKDLAASSAKTWGEIAQAIDDNFKGTTDPQKNELKWLRAIDKNGDPMLISAEDHAKVVGELIGTATATKDGLMPSNIFREASIMFSGGNNTIIKVDTRKKNNSYFFYIHSYDRINGGLYTVYSINNDGYKIKAGDENNLLRFYKDETSYYIELAQGKEFLIELKGDIINAQSVSIDTSTLTQLNERT